MSASCLWPSRWARVLESIGIPRDSFPEGAGSGRWSMVFSLSVRGVAQLGSAHRSGRWGRRFKSFRPDQFFPFFCIDPSQRLLSSCLPVHLNQLRRRFVYLAGCKVSGSGLLSRKRRCCTPSPDMSRTAPTVLFFWKSRDFPKRSILLSGNSGKDHLPPLWSKTSSVRSLRGRSFLPVPSKSAGPERGGFPPFLIEGCR